VEAKRAKLCFSKRKAGALGPKKPLLEPLVKPAYSDLVPQTREEKEERK